MIARLEVSNAISLDFFFSKNSPLNRFFLVYFGLPNYIKQLRPKIYSKTSVREDIEIFVATDSQ